LKIKAEERKKTKEKTRKGKRNRILIKKKKAKYGGSRAQQKDFLSFEWAASLWKQDFIRENKEGSRYSSDLKVYFII
jgi:hypothetical protein